MRAVYDLFTTVSTASLGARLVTAKSVAVSSTDTYYSKQMQVSEDGELGFELRTTGTPTGTLTLWFSNFEDPDEADDDDWIQDTSWSPTNPAGSAIKTLYSVTGIHARVARVKYVNSSGSGTLAGKQVVS